MTESGEDSQTAPEWHHLPGNPYNPHAWFVGTPAVGVRTWIGAFCVIDGSGGLTIGAGCDVSAGAQIYTHSTVARAVSSGVKDVERAPTAIGDNCHIGAGAIVLMGCTIGSNSVVAAGAVVPAFTAAPPYSLLVGVPARVVADGARKYG